MGVPLFCCAHRFRRYWMPGLSSPPAFHGVTRFQPLPRELAKAEIAFAVIATRLALAGVFLPVAFIRGQAARHRHPRGAGHGLRNPARGYASKFSGSAESLGETGRYVLFAFLLATVLTYMVLAAQFESFTQPLAIMMGLPLSFIGAFGLLLLVGNTLNLFSMIGLVLLVGLATKNGILLIDYANQLRRSGLPLDEALVVAGATRLRPILMTAISIIPVVLGIGEGSESRRIAERTERQAPFGAR